MADEEVGSADEIVTEVRARDVYVPSRGEPISAEMFRAQECMKLPAVCGRFFTFKFANAHESKETEFEYQQNDWNPYASEFLRHALQNICSSDDQIKAAYRVGQVVKCRRIVYVIVDYYKGSVVLLKVCRKKVCRDNPITISYEDLRCYTSLPRDADLDYQQSRDSSKGNPQRKRKRNQSQAGSVREGDDELDETDPFIRGDHYDHDADEPSDTKRSRTESGALPALDQREKFRQLRIDTDALDLEELCERLRDEEKITDKMSTKDMEEVAHECIRDFVLGDQLPHYVRLFMLSSSAQELRDLFGDDIVTVRKALTEKRKTLDQRLDTSLIVPERRRPEPFFDMHAVPPVQKVDENLIYAGDLMQAKLVTDKQLSLVQSAASGDPKELIEKLKEEIERLDQELVQEKRILARLQKEISKFQPPNAEHTRISISIRTQQADIKNIEVRRNRFVIQQKALCVQVEGGGQVATKGAGVRHSWTHSTVEVIGSDELHDHYIFGKEDRLLKIGGFMPKNTRLFYSMGKTPTVVIRSVALDVPKSYLLTVTKKDPNAFLDFEGKDIDLGTRMDCSLGVEEQQLFLMDIYTKEYPIAVKELSEKLLNHLTIDSTPLRDVLTTKGVEISPQSVIIPSWFYPQCGNDFRHITCGLKIANRQFGSVQMFLEKLMETCPYQKFFSASLPSRFEDLVKSRPLCMFSEKPEKNNVFGKNTELNKMCAAAMGKRVS